MTQCDTIIIRHEWDEIYKFELVYFSPFSILTTCVLIAVVNCYVSNPRVDKIVLSSDIITEIKLPLCR